MMIRVEKTQELESGNAENEAQGEVLQVAESGGNPQGDGSLQIYTASGWQSARLLAGLTSAQVTILRDSGSVPTREERCSKCGKLKRMHPSKTFCEGHSTEVDAARRYMDRTEPPIEIDDDDWTVLDEVVGVWEDVPLGTTVQELSLIHI